MTRREQTVHSPASRPSFRTPASSSRLVLPSYSSACPSLHVSLNALVGASPEADPSPCPRAFGPDPHLLSGARHPFDDHAAAYTIGCLLRACEPRGSSKVVAVRIWVAALVLVLVVTAAITIKLLVRRRAPVGGWFSDSSRSAGTLSVIGTMFAVMLAFVILLALQSYQRAREGGRASRPSPSPNSTPSVMFFSHP